MRRLVVWSLVASWLTAVFLAYSAHAAPQPFAVTWAHFYNRLATQNHWPRRVILIGCRAEPQGLHTCDVTLRYKIGGREECQRVVIGTTGQLLAATQFSCGPLTALYWNTEGVWRSHRA